MCAFLAMRQEIEIIQITNTSSASIEGVSLTEL
jgi:hypothetical protein